MMIDIPDINSSNKIVTDLLNDDKPFHVARLAGSLSTMCMYINKKQNPPAIHVKNAVTNDGMYYNEPSDLLRIAELYTNGICSADYLACFPSLVVEEQKYFLDKFKHIKPVHNRCLEPFYTDDTPWSKNLSGKKILVVTSHINSIAKQIQNNRLPDVWSDDQEFVLYKSYNTLAGNRLHSDCIETFNMMKSEISELEFDLAVLGCGGYGLMLGDFIKNNLNKSSIYIGGAIQLLFGVMGSRWLNNSLVRSKLKNFTDFIEPVEEDRINNYQSIENGCYW